jgi:RNA-splicing ligase RtcB
VIPVPHRKTATAVDSGDAFQQATDNRSAGQPVVQPGEVGYERGEAMNVLEKQIAQRS